VIDSNPTIIRGSVDSPQRECPTSVTNSPSAMETETP
jgi:hypothetical protein